MKKRVETICFGIESAGNISKNAAQAIDHSLKLLNTIKTVIVYLSTRAQLMQEVVGQMSL